MHWKLAREIESRRARGEAVTLEDFIVPPIPDDNNAAIPIRRVGGMARLNLKEEQCLDEVLFCRCFNPTKADLAAVGQIIHSRDSVFQAMSDSRRRTDVNWNVQWGAHCRTTDSNCVGDIRAVRWVLSYGAWLSHHEGDDGRAVQHVLDLIYLSRLAGVSEAPFAAHASALGSWWAAAASLHEMALTLRVEDSGGNRATSRGQVVELIQMMLDESSRREALNREWQARRTQSVEFSIDPSHRIPFINGDSDRVTMDLLQGYDRLRAAMMCANYPSAMREVRSPDPDRTIGIFSIGAFHPEGINLLPQFRVLTERRVAAVALALRLFALDHAGRLPEKLDELMPRYLPAVPSDPFAADGRALGYRAAPLPALYSVNRDGMDDGMDDRPLHRGYDEWDAKDAVFYLANDPSRPPKVYVPWTPYRGGFVAPKK